MGLIDKIRRALEKREVSALKKKISHFEEEVTKQGKRVESLIVVLNTRSLSLSRSHRFEFVLSDGTTNKPQNRSTKPKKISKNSKKPNRVNPVEKCPTEQTSVEKKHLKPTLVGRGYDYDEKCTWIEEYKPGVEVVFVARSDGSRDILKVRFGNGMSVPQNSIWWIDNEAKVCNKLNVTATRPSKAPKISSWTYYPKTINTEKY